MSAEKRQKKLNQAISLTTFVDFVLAHRIAKVAVVRRFLEQQSAGYAQHRDYYASFRRDLVGFHRCARPMGEFFDFVTGSAHSRKVTNYGHLARGYARCWATYFQESGYVWIDPPRAFWQSGSWRININPELAFSDGERAAFVKAYLKQEELTKDVATLVLHLLQLGLEPLLQNATVSIMDVRRGRLFEATSFDERLTVWLRGEVASFAAIFESIVADLRVNNDHISG